MDALFQNNPTTSILAAALAAVAVIITGIIAWRQNKLLVKYRSLLNGPVGTNLESLLLKQQQEIARLKIESVSLTQQMKTMHKQAEAHVQKTAIIRYNAFPDTGSDLSFAIALLDANDNGLVLSSLYGRSESRVYAKPILKGKSTYALSEEEREVLDKAGRNQ